MAAGIPIKLLHEGESHPVMVELKTGESYWGTLVESEDNMNVLLKRVTMTARNGQVSKLEHVYLRGSTVRYIVLPEILKNARMFRRVQKAKEDKEKEWFSGPRGRRGKKSA